MRKRSRMTREEEEVTSSAVMRKRGISVLSFCKTNVNAVIIISTVVM